MFGLPWFWMFASAAYQESVIYFSVLGSYVNGFIRLLPLFSSNKVKEILGLIQLPTSMSLENSLTMTSSINSDPYASRQKTESPQLMAGDTTSVNGTSTRMGNSNSEIIDSDSRIYTWSVEAHLDYLFCWVFVFFFSIVFNHLFSQQVAGSRISAPITCQVYKELRLYIYFAS